MKLPKMRGKNEDLGRNLKEKNIVAIDLWQWNCWKGRNKNSSNWFVAMLLPKWREKKVAIDLWILILDSYSKKYSYSYSFRVSVVFLTEAVWFVCMWCSFISYSKSILCMICPMKQIMNLDSKYIDSYFQKKKKYIFLNKKKVHRFLQYEMEEKKNDWCAHCKQKKQKNWDFCKDSLQWIYVSS